MGLLAANATKVLTLQGNLKGVQQSDARGIIVDRLHAVLGVEQATIDRALPESEKLWQVFDRARQDFNAGVRNAKVSTVGILAAAYAGASLSPQHPILGVGLFLTVTAGGMVLGESDLRKRTKMADQIRNLAVNQPHAP